MNGRQINGANPWHRRFVTMGSLLVTVGLSLIGAFGTIITIAVQNEHRLTLHESDILVMRTMMKMVSEKNKEQDERMTKMSAEERVATQQIIASLQNVITQLAIHDAEVRGRGEHNQR